MTTSSLGRNDLNHGSGTYRRKTMALGGPRINAAEPTLIRSPPEIGAGPDLSGWRTFRGNRLSEASGYALRLTELTINKRTSIRATDPDIYKCLQQR